MSFDADRMCVVCRNPVEPTVAGSMRCRCSVTAADRAAYVRLRDRGLHPDQIDGCAALEATATRENLGWGKRLSPEEIEEQREAQAAAQEFAS